MNEKIYKLAVDVGIIKEENCYFWIQSVDELEKFAELILKEVFKVCDDVCDSQTCAEYSLCEMFGIDHNWRLIDEQSNRTTS
jgi:hypothetical protein